MLVSLWKNPEINARIYLQACSLFAEGFLGPDKERFFLHAFAAMHKLSAVDYHLDNYRHLEANGLQAARLKFEKDPNATEEAFELIFELEAFIMQVKSSLDMLVKLLLPAIGDVVRTKTFKNKGEAVIKGLKQYRRKKGIRTDAVDRLIGLIKVHQQGWLQATIDFRDRLTHIEGSRNYYFLPDISNGKLLGVRKPQLLDRPTTDLMELIRSNNLIFHQDFMAFTLALRVPPNVVLHPADPDLVAVQFPGEAAKFVKWGWRLIIPHSESGHVTPRKS